MGVTMGGIERSTALDLREVAEVRGRDELRARPAVHVDELREEELDSAPLDDLLDLLQPRVRRDGHGVLLVGGRPVVSPAVERE